MTWSGLGWSCSGSYPNWWVYTDAVADSEDPKWLPLFANLFPRVRNAGTYFGYDGSIEATVYPSATTTYTQRLVKKWKQYNPSIYTLYGDSNSVVVITDHPELSRFMPSSNATWESYQLQNVAWARDNGVDAFSLGNENLLPSHHYTSATSSSNKGMVPTSLSRSSNVATAVFSYLHGLTTGDYIFVANGTDASFRVADPKNAETVQCTVVDPYTITYPSTGSDGSAAGSYKINWSSYEVVRKIKALAAQCRAIAPNLTYVYSESAECIEPWIALGITPGVDIDLAALNVYGDGVIDSGGLTYGRTYFTAKVDAWFAKFGTDMIITETGATVDDHLWKVAGVTFEDRGFDKACGEECVWRMNYVRNLGVTQMYFFPAIEGQIRYNTYPGVYSYFKGGIRPWVNDIKEIPRNGIFLGTGKLDAALVTSLGGNYWD